MNWKQQQRYNEYLKKKSEEEKRIKKDAPKIKRNQSKANKCREKQIKCKWISENNFKDILDSIGIGYEYQKTFVSVHWWYVADFYIPELKMIIEIDGHPRHRTTKGAQRDRVRDKRLLTLDEVSSIRRLTIKQSKNRDKINKMLNYSR